MNKSESVKNLAAALSAAQAEMPGVAMNAVNPFLKNKFADLGAVISTARPILQKHGLSFSQMPFSESGRVGVDTIVMHSSGEWIESSIALDLSEEKGKSAAQVAGSIITYLRRYSLAAAFGMYADEDSDGSQPEKKESNVITADAWDKYQALVKRAKAVEVPIPDVDRKKTTLAELRAIYKELDEHVRNAEEQAQAGE